ncbi:hypothetical protein LIER_30593 [Lithospermum erythrorhizon]|uniref:Uncharacterized protein n=1 Tax=Lithospermum erythrorhizon TaxID=34254 RepID=A0AAV3RTE8_LITER
MLTRGVPQTLDFSFKPFDLFCSTGSFNHGNISIPTQLSNLDNEAGTLLLELVPLKGDLFMLLAKNQIVLYELLLLSVEEDVDLLTLSKFLLHHRHPFFQLRNLPIRALGSEVLILLSEAMSPPRQIEANISDLRTKRKDKQLKKIAK